MILFGVDDDGNVKGLPDVKPVSYTHLDVYKRQGYMMIIYISGIQNIPGELIEAAQIDGANKVQLLRYEMCIRDSACVEHLNRHGRMQRGRNDQMDRIHIRVLQYRFKVGGVVAVSYTHLVTCARSWQKQKVSGSRACPPGATPAATRFRCAH